MTGFINNPGQNPNPAPAPTGSTGQSAANNVPAEGRQPEQPKKVAFHPTKNIAAKPFEATIIGQQADGSYTIDVKDHDGKPGGQFVGVQLVPAGTEAETAHLREVK